jgi:hypothetical protein
MSSPYGPHELGYTRATKIVTTSYTIKKFRVNLKKLSCSDCRLKFVYMKLESQVIVNHHVTVNLVPSFLGAWPVVGIWLTAIGISTMAST